MYYPCCSYIWLHRVVPQPWKEHGNPSGHNASQQEERVSQDSSYSPNCLSVCLCVCLVWVCVEREVGITYDSLVKFSSYLRLICDNLPTLGSVIQNSNRWLMMNTKSQIGTDWESRKRNEVLSDHLSVRGINVPKSKSLNCWSISHNLEFIQCAGLKSWNLSYTQQWPQTLRDIQMTKHVVYHFNQKSNCCSYSS